jgi:O-acetyl-ADP-ribose deacetylase
MNPTDRIAIERGDITDLDVDAIVNAANAQLLPGGGVCGAIHRAAGPELAKACAAIGPCPTGSAVMTPGFALKARHVIHAVGPVWQGGHAGEARDLAECYRASLALCRDHGLADIAFPAISTGIYGFPPEQAAEIALAAVLAWLKDQDWPRRVIFVCFDTGMETIYRVALNRQISNSLVSE